ncbi:hypothetical protein [Catenuloplanes atrovinosus]|uniref:Uncharacterized protein n=1 Tax=Catenuloplanes atrovinosus TaxID=137266 RepID=A0AAE4C8R4_9ACTN|nr:hypothetical protein [Catenuloplanes atrovinosus]MDR7275263.1 hypothetical protein [Catenuloplanes atrovinosus]
MFPDGRPSRIAIEPDDHHAEHVGRTADGRQFFLTTPFEPEGEEFIALYLFDAGGRLLEAKIDSFGHRDTLDEAAHEAAYDARLAELGEVTIARIEVEPFAVDRFGTTFGLVAWPPEEEDEDDEWWVIAEPGDYMAFSAPWDSGEYDT